jgi:hypothetical protein
MEGEKVGRAAGALLCRRCCWGGGLEEEEVGREGASLVVVAVSVPTTTAVCMDAGERAAGAVFFLVC